MVKLKKNESKIMRIGSSRGILIPAYYIKAGLIDPNQPLEIEIRRANAEAKPLKIDLEDDQELKEKNHGPVVTRTWLGAELVDFDGLWGVV